MKFNIEYYLDKLEKLDKDPMISQRTQDPSHKELYLARKIFFRFIFLEAINQKLNEVNSDYLKIVYSLMKECFNYLEGNPEYQIILAQKLLIMTIFLKSKISQKTANLSEIEVRKYNLLSDNFATKIKYILKMQRTYFMKDIKTYLIPMLIDPGNSIFLEFFLDNIAHNTTFPDSRITYINNNIKKMRLLTPEEKSFFSFFFYPDGQPENIIRKLTDLPYIDRLLKFQLILSNLNKFPETFFQSKTNKEIIYDTLLVHPQSVYSNQHSGLIFVILNYDSLRFFLKNTYKILNLQSVAKPFSQMLFNAIQQANDYAQIYHMTRFNIEKSFIKFSQLMINYGLHFNEKTIMDSNDNLFKLGEVYKFYIESLIHNWKLALNKSMNQNYIPIILKDDPRIIKNILLHKELIKFHLINRNISQVMQNISLPQEIDLSSLDNIALLAEKFFFEIFAIKKYEKPGIFGDQHIMHLIGFYLTDFETFRKLVVQSYLNEAEIIEEIEKNIPIMRDNLLNAIKANDKEEVEYILSNMDAKHFDEIKLEELIYVRNTDIIDKKYYNEILMKHINIDIYEFFHKMKVLCDISELENILIEKIDLIDDPNLKKSEISKLINIIKLDDGNFRKIKGKFSEILPKTDIRRLFINNGKKLEQDNIVEDSDKLPNSPSSNIISPPQKRQRQ